MHRKKTQKVDAYLERANSFDCSPYNAHGYRGMCCNAVPGPLYVFPVPKNGLLVIPFNEVKEKKFNEVEEKKNARAIRLVPGMQRTVFPLLSATSVDEVVEKSFQHYSLPSGQDQELTESSQWAMDCEQGIYLGVRYFRFDAKETVFYLFPPSAGQHEDILLVLTQSPQHEHQPYMAHIVQIRSDTDTYQQEVLEADCLEHLFDRFLKHYREKEMVRSRGLKNLRTITTVLACLLILVIQTIAAIVIWRLGTPLVRNIHIPFLLWIAVATTGLGGALIALRPLRFAPQGPQDERPLKKHHQALLSGILLLLEGAILVYEVRGNHTYPLTSLPSIWLLVALILMIPFIIGRQLVPAHPLLAYRPQAYDPWRRPSIAILLARARLTKMVQHLRGYLPIVGMTGLPVNSSITMINGAPASIIVNRAMVTIASSTKVATGTPTATGVAVSVDGIRLVTTTTTINGAPTFISTITTTVKGDPAATSATSTIISITSRIKAASGTPATPMTGVSVVVDGTPAVGITPTINGAPAVISTIGTTLSINSSTIGAKGTPTDIAVSVDGSQLDITTPTINGAPASIVVIGTTVSINSSIKTAPAEEKSTPGPTGVSIVVDGLPLTTSPLLLDRDYLHTYQIGSSRMPPHSCRIRVYHAEWNDLSAPEPPLTLILCSIIPPGDISLHAEQIATAIWHKEDTPQALIWIEHWWSGHQPSEFCCVQFHCDHRGILSSSKRFPIERSKLAAMVQEPLEELADPSKKEKSQSSKTKRA